MSSDVREELKRETEKWLNRIERMEITSMDSEHEDFVRNIKAYIEDARYFLNREDYVRAFEAVIWAWAWLEIGEQLGILSRKG